MMRSILAVVGGFVAVVVLSLGMDVILHMAKVYPPWGQLMSDPLFALATAYRVVFTIVGGWLTARLAPDRPMFHVWVLAAVGAIAGAAGAFFGWNHPELGPRWYSLAIFLTAIPCTWLGGKLHSRP